MSQLILVNGCNVIAMGSQYKDTSQGVYDIHNLFYYLRFSGAWFQFVIIWTLIITIIKLLQA